MIRFKTKTIQVLALGLILSAGLLTSCDTGEDPMPMFDTDRKVTIKAGASYSGGASANGRMASDVTISKFIVNLKEIEFEIDEDDPRYGMDSTFTDTELEGPFVIDLLSDTIAINIAAADIPYGIYEEVEFKIDESRDATSELFDKSVIIEGSVGGIPFTFWTDEDEDFEIDFNSLDGNLDIDSAGFVLTFNFNIDLLLSAIDFTQVADGNEDGLIEIYPDDPDGNSDFADDLLDELSEIVEMEEEQDLDEDGIENDEDDDIDGDGIDNDEDEDDDNDGTNDDEDEDDDNDGENDEDEEDEDDEDEDDDD